MFYKSKFTNSDDNEILEGYTDGTLCSGWANVYFTREQLFEAVSPYDVQFCDPHTLLNMRDYPIAIVYFEGELVIESSLIVTTEGDMIEAYTLSEFEFIEVD